MAEPPARPRLPTPLARRFVRYLVGFGVAVAVGSAPFLGTLGVPLFTALLDLFPVRLQDRFVALSPFVMGVVAVAVQFYAGERLGRRTLRRRFRITLILLAVAFVGLISIYTLMIEEVPILGNERSVRYVIGFERLERCPCPTEWSDARCLADSLDPTRIESCWSRGTVRTGELALTLVYLLTIGAFASLIGLLLLAEERRREKR